MNDLANPAFLGNTNYASVDPEVLAAFGLSIISEDNAHQAEFTIDNRFIIGTDEDFDPYRLTVTLNHEAPTPASARLTPDVVCDIPTILIGRDAGFVACAGDTQEMAPIPIGTVGDPITDVGSTFDGWGYVHLIDAKTLELLDTFVIPEAMDPDFAEVFGDLSIHEVAVSAQDPTLAYLSYYAGCAQSRFNAPT